MRSIREILDAEGTSVEDMDVGESYSYDGGDAINDLAIEKIAEDRLSVAQYYTQRGDLMRDPEVVFDVSDPDSWTPVEYRQDGFPNVHQRDEAGVDINDEFLETWDDNLGYQFPTEEIAGGDSQ